MSEKECMAQAPKTLPDGWRMVKFGDVVCNVNISEHNPMEKGLERFVGLEHIDPGSLQIKRWGMIEDGITFTRKFVKGQVLFGKRRSYQGKLAVADFDGVCSGDILVFESKDGKLISELLPFIVQNDNFFDFAIGTSSGSLSPRTKWKHLATYEFPLPPIDEQRRIADMLWAAEECSVNNEKLVDEIELYKRILMKELFTKGIGHKEFNETEIGTIPRKWEIVKLGDITDDFVGGGTPSTSNISYWDGEIAWMTSAHIIGRLVISGQRYITEKGLNESSTHLVPKGNLLVATRVGIGKVAINLIDVAISQDLTGVILNKDKASVDFVYWSLVSNSNRLNSLAQGSTIKGVLKEDLLNLKFPLPPLHEQCRIAEILSKIDDNTQKVKENIIRIKTLEMRLLNHLLAGGLKTVHINPNAKQQYEAQVSE